MQARVWDACQGQRGRLYLVSEHGVGGSGGRE